MTLTTGGIYSHMANALLTRVRLIYSCRVMRLFFVIKWLWCCYTFGTGVVSFVTAYFYHFIGFYRYLIGFVCFLWYFGNIFKVLIVLNSTQFFMFTHVFHKYLDTLRWWIHAFFLLQIWQLDFLLFRRWFTSFGHGYGDLLYVIGCFAFTFASYFLQLIGLEPFDHLFLDDFNHFNVLTIATWRLQTRSVKVLGCFGWYFMVQFVFGVSCCMDLGYESVLKHLSYLWSCT